MIFHTDNMALVEIINRQTSKHGQVLHLLRHLVLSALNLNILFKACHIPGAVNSAADALSRLDFQSFFAAHPTAALTPVPLPPSLLPEVLIVTPR